MAAAVTGLIAFVLFLAGGLLLWANAHYKDADGYVSTASERFERASTRSPRQARDQRGAPGRSPATATGPSA